MQGEIYSGHATDAPCGQDCLKTRNWGSIHGRPQGATLLYTTRSACKSIVGSPLWASIVHL